MVVAGSVEVVTCSGFFYNETKGIKEHKHPVFQIFYVTSGNCVFWYEGKGVSISSGEFLLVSPNRVHGLIPPSTKTSVLDMKFNVPDQQFEKEIMKLPPKCSGNPQAVKRLFSMIEDEAREKESYFNQLMSLYLESIFCLLLRESYNQLREYDSGENIYEKLGIEYDRLSTCVKAAIAQMDGLIACPINHFNLQYLADTIGYSKRYLSQTFSREMGCSVYQFMSMLRMDKAKELLIHSSLSIKEIAAMLDFRNDSYFSTQFAQAVGESPNAYRKRCNTVGNDYLKYSFHDEFKEGKGIAEPILDVNESPA